MGHDKSFFSTVSSRLIVKNCACDNHTWMLNGHWKLNQRKEANVTQLQTIMSVRLWMWMWMCGVCAGILIVSRSIPTFHPFIRICYFRSWSFQVANHFCYIVNAPNGNELNMCGGGSLEEVCHITFAHLLREHLIGLDFCSCQIYLEINPNWFPGGMAWICAWFTGCK